MKEVSYSSFGGRRHGKKTRKGRKARRMTRRRGGNLFPKSLFPKSNLAPRPEPGTSVLPGSVAAKVMKDKNDAYDLYTQQATDRLSINAIPGAQPKKAGRSRKH